MPGNNETSQQLLDILRSVDLFRNIPVVAIEALASKVMLYPFRSGQLIIQKGDVGNSMYVIVKGAVKIHDKDVTIAQLREGSFFGEMSLIDKEPRSMSVSSIEDTILGKIEGVDFYMVMKNFPDATLEFGSAITKRLRSQNASVVSEILLREEKLKELVEERTLELRKQTERAEEMKERAEASEKFKQQFLANMSHEIRTPMNSIVGLTNLLLNSPLNDQQKKYLNVISKSSDNLLVIINDILDLAKIEAGKMVFEKIPFVLAEALDTVYHTLRFKADDKKLEFNYTLDSEIPKVLIGDPVRLNQILINIAGNAIKFTEKGSVTIIVMASSGHAKPGMHALKFLIKDTGIGIPKDKLGHIFESFSQAGSDTTRKFGGTGLGLTISKQLIELQGGTIGVESDPGQGTTFIVSLTYPEGTMEQMDVKKDDSAASRGELIGTRILLAEDNPFNQMVAVDTLEELIKEVKVTIAENGKIALEKLQAEDYDIVLMDIQMPELDGFETTRKIRELTTDKSKTPIMAMTANVTKEEVEKCFQSGMDEYIAKPFKPQDLLSKIGALVNRGGKK